MNLTRLYCKAADGFRNRMINFTLREQDVNRYEKSKEEMLTTKEGIQVDWMSHEYQQRLIRMKRKKVTMTQMKALLRSEAKEKLVVSILDIKEFEEPESSRTIDRELADLIQACMDLKRTKGDNLSLLI